MQWLFKHRANIYISLWFVYYLFSYLWWEESAFRQTLSVALIAVSFYYFVVVNIRFKLPVYFYGLNLLVVMLSIYGVDLMIGYNPEEYSLQTSSYNYLKMVYRSLLPIYAFYYFTKFRLLSNKDIYIWIFFFFLLATVGFYGNKQMMMLYALSIKSTRLDFTNNLAYAFLALLPMISFLYKKTVIQYLSLFYCFAFMLFSGKRGAVIIGVICFIFIIWCKLKERENMKTKAKMLVLCFIAGIVCFVFIQKQMSTETFIKERVERTLDGNMSKRDNLYAVFADYFWNKTTPFQFVFGSGANSTTKISFNYAHNDWLEISVNQGILGVLVYIFYWASFAYVILSKNYEPHIKQALQLLFIIYFMKTFFSMSYASMPIEATFVLGHCLAQEKSNEQVVYSN